MNDYRLLHDHYHTTYWFRTHGEAAVTYVRLITALSSLSRYAVSPVYYQPSLHDDYEWKLIISYL